MLTLAPSSHLIKLIEGPKQDVRAGFVFKAELIVVGLLAVFDNSISMHTSHFLLVAVEGGAGAGVCVCVCMCVVAYFILFNCIMKLTSHLE